MNKLRGRRFDRDLPYTVGAQTAAASTPGAQVFNLL
jgi:hypothetical protein